MAELKVKGSLYVSRLKYLDQYASGEQRGLIFERLSPECRAYLAEPKLPSIWCPLGYVDELMIAMDAVLGKGDLRMVEEFGRFSAEQACRGIYRVFMRLGSPKFVMHRFPAFWSQLINHGAIVVEKVIDDSSKTSYEIHLEHCDVPFPKSFVHSLLGWTAGWLEIAGAKRLKMRIGQFPRLADPNCGYFVATWEK